MIKLDELKLSDLLPSSIMNDKTITAMAAALDKELQEITACINEIVMLPRIDELPEDIVDSLAWQFHTDFYEPLGLGIEKKRALVKSSLSWHRRKGTKSVLEEVIRILFLDDFTIEEWYEYGGEPYFFRLIINDAIESKEKFDNLIRAVQELKNVRSWLEIVIVKANILSHQYHGGTLSLVPRFNFCDEQPTSIDIGSAQYPTSVFALSTSINFTEKAVGGMNIKGRSEAATVFSLNPRMEVSVSSRYQMNIIGDSFHANNITIKGGIKIGC